MLHGKVCLHQHYRLSQHTFLDKMVLLWGFERGGTKRLLFKRYFRPMGHGKFRLDPLLCKQVDFEVVNLLDTAYSHNMQSPDIILYRNVSIYFPGSVQQQIFRQLANILVKGGYLIVGATETMHHDVSILSLIKQGALFVYRKTPHTVYQNRRIPSEYAPSPELERRTPSLVPATHPDPSTEGKLLGRLKGHQAVPVSHKLPTDSQSAQERYETALDLARNHRADESLALLDAVIQQDATCAKAYTLKAHLLLNASRFDELVDVCHLAIDKDIRCSTIHLMLGMAARHQGDDQNALKRLREAIYLDASCWLAHFLSAEIHYGQGDKKRSRSGYEAAVRILDKAADLDRGDFPLTFNADQFVVTCRHKLSLLNNSKNL